jgi:hypothetical protein
MTDQTDIILAEILTTQKRLLQIDEELLANSRLVVARQRSALVWALPFILLILLSPYLPWLINRLFNS